MALADFFLDLQVIGWRAGFQKQGMGALDLQKIDKVWVLNQIQANPHASFPDLTK
jgi:hypothetical protein